ncbi:MAG: bifunctional homocysteine S-methyltransferase/methylenetetrahydrofolate reductase [Verrucomicrobia bacterium]|nr:bifunctional homocysteine S-methyltransferase/methylenetetrahydrofolate reductase [Verrucomicrobiota bacterium]
MKLNLLERMEAGIVIGDGAMGTLLYERGLSLDRCCEELVLTQNDTVRRVHEDYVAAGAQVIETNSFAANRVKLARHGLEHRVVEINRQAAQIASETAKGRDVLVAGSVGPMGILMEEARERNVHVPAIFWEQIGALLEGGADFILLETFSDLDELKLAISAAKTLGNTPLVCSMSFTEDGVTHRGAPMADAFAALRAAGATVVGANCCVGPRALGALFKTKAPPLGGGFYSAYPNAGRPEFLDGRYFYPTTAGYFASRCVELVRCGVRLVGGCCGTRPEHIAALRETLRVAIPQSPSAVSVAREPPPTAPSEAATERRLLGAAPSRPTLLDIIQTRTLIITEFDSPKTLLLDKMMEAARALKEAGTDFLTVADNSLAVLRMNCVTAAHLVEERTGLRSIVHFACRDRNLIGTQSELMGMDALGLNHVLALTGDPSKVGDTPGATSVYDLNSISLLEGIRAMNAGKTFGGRDLKRVTRFVAGCTFNPNVKNLDVQVKRLERKIAAGAQFVMTQPVFDVALVRATCEAVARFNIPVLVGVMPLLNARNTEFLHNEVPGISIPDVVRERMRGKEGDDGAREGVAVARAIAAEVLSRFKGIYLITPLVRYDTTVALSSVIRAGSL